MSTPSWTPCTRYVLALALGLAACGGDDDDTGDDANDSAPTATDPSAGSSGASADDATASADDDATADATADDDGSSGITSAESSGDDATATNPTMTTTLDSGEDSSSGGGAELEECTMSDPLCGDGEMCRPSMCCEDGGFCVFAAAPTCGGFTGMPCPDGLVCVLDQCVADGDGRCVDADIATAIQEAQPGCWSAG